MSERDRDRDREEESSFDDEEFLSTRPPPADVHNASTAVANLPTTLLDSLKSPNAKLDSASISALLATTLASSESAPREENEDEDDYDVTSSNADLDSLPLLDEPDPLDYDDAELALLLTRSEGPVVEVHADGDGDEYRMLDGPIATAPFAQTESVPSYLQQHLPAWSDKTLVLLTIAVGAAVLGLIGTATWLAVGLFQ